MFIKLYFITLPVFLAVDMLWLGFIAKNMYTKYLGFLMKPDVNWGAALLFYLLYILGLVVFVITPALEKQSWVQALLMGALFGLIAYATYDLTNLATVKDWPIIVTVIDLCWGMVLSGVVSLISFFISTKLSV
jgi:uncharacterized membrane protein